MNCLSLLDSLRTIPDLAALLIMLIAALLCVDAAIYAIRIVLEWLSGTGKRKALGIETVALLACAIAGSFLGRDWAVTTLLNTLARVGMLVAKAAQLS